METFGVDAGVGAAVTDGTDGGGRREDVSRPVRLDSEAGVNFSGTLIEADSEPTGRPLFGVESEGTVNIAGGGEEVSDEQEEGGKDSGDFGGECGTECGSSDSMVSDKVTRIGFKKALSKIK